MSRKATSCFAPLVLAVSAWITLTLPVRAQQVNQAIALGVKAGYLLKFPKFIDWPDDVFDQKDAPFVIGVLGDDPLAKRLEHDGAGKRVGTHPVKIRRFHWAKQDERVKLKECQVLYIGRAEQNRLAEIVAFLKGTPVLLVSDIDGFARDGGMIGLVLKGKSIVFEICREALRRVGLKADAGLLKLSHIVKARNRAVQGHRIPNGNP